MLGTGIVFAYVRDWNCFCIIGNNVFGRWNIYKFWWVNRYRDFRADRKRNMFLHEL